MTYPRVQMGGEGALILPVDPVARESLARGAVVRSAEDYAPKRERLLECQGVARRRAYRRRRSPCLTVARARAPSSSPITHADCAGALATLEERVGGPTSQHP